MRTITKPNILFIMMDQLHYRCLGFQNHPQVKTPNLDRLRQDSVFYQNTYVANAYCLPSRTSILTGQYLFNHRQYGFTGILEESAPCLYQFFKNSGYYTFHVGKAHVNSIGENLGFHEFLATIPEDIYRSTDLKKNYQAYSQERGITFANDQVHGMDYPPEVIATRPEVKDPAFENLVGASHVPLKDSLETYIADNAIEFIGRPHDQPFFLNVSFDRPHHPLTPPTEFAGLYDPRQIPMDKPLDKEEVLLLPKHLQDYYYQNPEGLPKAGEEKLRILLSQYYALITYTDHEIGRVLTALKEKGLYDSTAIVFLSDHGDFAGYRGFFNKFPNRAYHDDIIRSPLLIKYPGNENAGATVSRLSETISLFPTLASVAGLDTISLPLDGINLRDLDGDQKTSDRDLAWSEAYSIKMIRKGNWKLIHYVNSNEGELYDLEHDPHERQNLFADPVWKSKVLELKVEIIKKLTPVPSEARKSYIHSLFQTGAMREMGAMDPLYKWERGIIEGGGFWMIREGQDRFYVIPFEDQWTLERERSKTLFHIEFGTVKDDALAIHYATQLIDYIATKIRPISIMIGSAKDRENLLTTKGSGLL